MIRSRRALTGAILCVMLAATGCAEISKKAGVENRWREPNIVLQEGVTTQQQVLAQLGPPSQLIALPEKTVFYYLFEETKGRLVFLILYNQANTDITYDRAIFFFHKNGILETYAFSKKAQE
jgi:outer membrane protein assembly factor BamE (lipoprotein component of BamABCDE complex)